MKNQKSSKSASVSEPQRKSVSSAPPKKEVWAADSETDPARYGRIPRPFIWGAFNGAEYHEFWSTPDFVNFITQRECIVYAHNGGKFDWHYLLELLEPETELSIIAGRIAKFKLGKAEFRDSFNIMPMPLAAGGKKLEIDLSILEADKRDIPANREIIRERCRTDCVYLWHLLDTFFNEFGLHLTISGASMNAWAKISEIQKPETSDEFYATFYPYYFGGRVEVFEPGIIEEDFVMIDKNSAYPHAMLSLHPWGTVPYESLSLPNSRGAIQRCFITLVCASSGAFPYRDTDGGLCFPADNAVRRFHVTGWEFLSALETSSLNDYEIEKVVTLPESIHFRSYMDHFYKMKTDAKEADDTARYEFSKRFLCSLYGKFGANPDNYYEYKIIQPRYVEAACEADGYVYAAQLGKWALLSRPLIPARRRYYNVAVAASITGYVRADMWRALRAVERPLYCDTDGIACIDSGNLPLHASDLGAWKVEATCDYGAFAGPKLYACRTDSGKWKKASKGVKLSYNEIVDIANGKTIEYFPEFPQYSVKRGIQFQTRKIRRTAQIA